MKMKLDTYKQGSHAEHVCENPFLCLRQKMVVRETARDTGRVDVCEVELTIAPGTIGAKAYVEHPPTIDEKEVFELACDLLEMTIIRRESELEFAKELYSNFKKEPTP